MSVKTSYRVWYYPRQLAGVQSFKSYLDIKEAMAFAMSRKAWQKAEVEELKSTIIWSASDE